MDLNDKENANNTNYAWEWQESDFFLEQGSRNVVSHCLWDELNQNEDSLMYMLDEQTPIKDCADFEYQIADLGDNTNKELEESRETSLMKRRRMLQFTSDIDDIDTGNEEFSSGFIKSKVMEDSLMEDEPAENFSSQWNSGLQESRCAFNSEPWNQPSEGWPVDCFDESEMHCSPNEMSVPLTDCVASDDQINDSEYHDISHEVESGFVKVTRIPTPRKTLKGKRSYLKTPTKFTTSVAYPFALIKPCGGQGDLTLKDINQRIHAPPPSRSKHIKDENPSLSYPTSAYSGKPVVVKTKIRTEGGKGSITIMRTKG